MKLFHIILKLMAVLHLVTTDELEQLRLDTVSWEQDCKKENANKIQQLYAKLHEGIMFRLASPFLYIFLQRWVNEQLNGKSEDKDDYELP